MTNAILSPHQSAFGVSAVLLVIIYWNFEFIQDTDIYEALSDILSDMLYGGLNNLSATMALVFDDFSFLGLFEPMFTTLQLIWILVKMALNKAALISFVLNVLFVFMLSLPKDSVLVDKPIALCQELRTKLSNFPIWCKVVVWHAATISWQIYRAGIIEILRWVTLRRALDVESEIGEINKAHVEELRKLKDDHENELWTWKEAVENMRAGNNWDQTKAKREADSAEIIRLQARIKRLQDNLDEASKPKPACKHEGFVPEEEVKARLERRDIYYADHYGKLLGAESEKLHDTEEELAAERVKDRKAHKSNGKTAANTLENTIKAKDGTISGLRAQILTANTEHTSEVIRLNAQLKSLQQEKTNAVSEVKAQLQTIQQEKTALIKTYSTTITELNGTISSLRHEKIMAENANAEIVRTPTETTEPIFNGPTFRGFRESKIPKKTPVATATKTTFPLVQPTGAPSMPALLQQPSTYAATIQQQSQLPSTLLDAFERFAVSTSPSTSSTATPSTSSSSSSPSPSSSAPEPMEIIQETIASSPPLPEESISTPMPSASPAQSGPDTSTSPAQLEEERASTLTAAESHSRASVKDSLAPPPLHAENSPTPNLSATEQEPPAAQQGTPTAAQESSAAGQEPPAAPKPQPLPFSPSMFGNVPVFGKDSTGGFVFDPMLLQDNGKEKEKEVGPAAGSLLSAFRGTLALPTTEQLSDLPRRTEYCYIDRHIYVHTGHGNSALDIGEKQDINMADTTASTEISNTPQQQPSTISGSQNIRPLSQPEQVLPQPSTRPTSSPIAQNSQITLRLPSEQKGQHKLFHVATQLLTSSVQRYATSIPVEAPAIRHGIHKFGQFSVRKRCSIPLCKGCEAVRKQRYTHAAHQMKDNITTQSQSQQHATGTGMTQSPNQPMLSQDRIQPSFDPKPAQPPQSSVQAPTSTSQPSPYTSQNPSSTTSQDSSNNSLPPHQSTAPNSSASNNDGIEMLHGLKIATNKSAPKSLKASPLQGLSTDKALDMMSGWTANLNQLLDKWVFQEPTTKENEELKGKIRWIGNWTSAKLNPERSLSEKDRLFRETCIAMVAEKLLDHIAERERAECGVPPAPEEVKQQERLKYLTEAARIFQTMDTARRRRGPKSHDLYKRSVLENGVEATKKLGWNDVAAECERILKGSLWPVLNSWLTGRSSLTQVESLKVTLGHITLYVLSKDVNTADKDTFMWAGRELVRFIETLSQYVAKFPRMDATTNTPTETVLFSLDPQIKVIQNAERRRANRQNSGAFVPQTV